MIIFPAVDIQDGKAVRLKQGRAHESTVFSPNPVAAAVAWRDKGARWLHVVDLDGAFDGLPKSRDIVRNICRELDIPVQLGGGIRDEQTAPCLSRSRCAAPDHRYHGPGAARSLCFPLQDLSRADRGLSRCRGRTPQDQGLGGRCPV